LTRFAFILGMVPPSFFVLLQRLEESRRAAKGKRPAAATSEID
jgi:hypothetical protein